MQYRAFPKLPDLPISTLGFGCMRLPLEGADPSHIDEAAATALLHEAIEAGVNYVDTAWPYHAGASEPFVGRALAGPWRERVQLATKLPVWLVETEADWERYLEQQLVRLATDRIDFYLLHALEGERWETVQRLSGLAALERARAAGLVRHVGFSFHGPPETFRQIVDGYDWDFCQIQFNYLDEQYQAGIDGLRHAAARRVGTIAMEPLRGGALAAAPPDVERIFARTGRPWRPAEWALRWVWRHPEVVTLLSGMNAPAQLRENIAAACDAGPLADDDLAAVEAAKAFFHARMAVPCTTCGYCLPCPQEVSIPDVFAFYNAAHMFGSKAEPGRVYEMFFRSAGAGGDRCIECGECRSKCPQSIAIPERLKEADDFLVDPAH